MSSDENFPITDEPTRDSGCGDDDADSMGFLAHPGFDASVEVPDRIGDYQIRQLIGSGGMGNVYLAEHTRMGRTVAIKMLPIDRMKDASAIARFYDEVRAASRLLHPNIVTAFDAGESDGGIHYLAMEYVDGVTLTRWVTMRGPLSVGEAAAIIRQAALGLLHAHRAGIVHRDVKPGNLMRASDGTVKVLDLGLARINSADLPTTDGDGDVSSLLEMKSSRGRLVGTLPFMSPEQLEDPDSADPRSDIYSLGATMYFLLTTTPPFTGEYLDQVYGHRHGEIPDLMQVRGDIDLHFANIFARMMAKKPDHRYASLDELVDELSPYASHVDAPIWLAELSQRAASSDLSTRGGGSTFSGGSTSGSASKVMAIDFGMFYSACAMASPIGGVDQLPAGGKKHVLFRMAIASDEERLMYGSDAIERRGAHPQSLVHCLPMYIGKPMVDRKVAGRSCPPEVLMAMLMRRIRANAWPDSSPLMATAITVPSSYDQLHRRSVLQAATMAGLSSVRLVDRSVAAVQSLLLESDRDLEDSGLREDSLRDIASQQSQLVLFIGVSGQASEFAVIRRDASRLHQLSTSGHWHQGTLVWLHRLVDLAAATFAALYGVDPRRSMRTAAALQMACERAMNLMLLSSNATIKIKLRGEEKSVTIDREDWLDSCDDLIGDVRSAIARACDQASIRLADVDVCVTMGAVMRISAVRDAVTVGLSPSVERRSVDRSDVARGAAACLAAELPGRGDIAMPPRGVTSQAIGIVIEDAKGDAEFCPLCQKARPCRPERIVVLVWLPIAHR